MASKDGQGESGDEKASKDMLESEKSKNDERALVRHEYTEEDLLGPFVGLKIDFKPITAESLWQFEDEKLCNNFILVNMFRI